jgi:hypothetical protein
MFFFKISKKIKKISKKVKIFGEVLHWHNICIYSFFTIRCYLHFFCVFVLTSRRKSHLNTNKFKQDVKRCAAKRGYVKKSF